MTEDEFDEFYEGSFDRLHRQVYALIGDAEEARDCLQDAYVRAWSRRRKLRRSGNPEAFVRLTAHRIAISRWRRHGRVRPTDELMDTPQQPVDERHVALVAALAQINEAQRRALVLHYLADLSVAEIAAETGAAEGTVKARLSRGRAAMADLLTDSPDKTQDSRHA